MYPHSVPLTVEDASMLEQAICRLSFPEFDLYEIGKLAIKINHANKPKVLLWLALCRNWLIHRLIPIWRKLGSWTLLVDLRSIWRWVHG